MYRLILILLTVVGFSGQALCQTQTPTFDSLTIRHGINTGSAIIGGTPPLLQAANNAALKALSTTGMVSGQTTIVRLGFTNQGDGGGASYTYSTANCVSPDNGARISPTYGIGCWNIGAQPIYDVRVWGAKCDGSSDDTTAITAARAFSPALSYPQNCIFNAVAIPDFFSLQRTTSGVPPSATAAVPTLHVTATKTGTTSGYRSTAVFGEGIDSVGGNGTFVEGGRFHGTVSGSSGQGNGIVCLAQNLSGIAWDFLIGCEADIENLGADQPLAANTNHLAVGFLATNGMASNTHTADAGFATNPFNPHLWNTGFAVYGGVLNAAFQSTASTSYGLDLSGATNSYCAICLPNNSAVRIKGVSTDLNVMYVPSGSDSLILGTSTYGIALPATNPPATPGTGFFSIYVDNADGKLKAKGPSGAVSVLANP